MKPFPRTLVTTFVLLAGSAAALAGSGATRHCPGDAVVYEKGGGVSAPVVVEKVAPTYPEDARKEGVTGDVVVDIVVDSTGEVGPADVVEEPDPRLGSAAVDAVRQWRFEPATDGGGEPVKVCYLVTIRFRLD